MQTLWLSTYVLLTPCSHTLDLCIALLRSLSLPCWCMWCSFSLFYLLKLKTMLTCHTLHEVVLKCLAESVLSFSILIVLCLSLHLILMLLLGYITSFSLFSGYVSKNKCVLAKSRTNWKATSIHMSPHCTGKQNEYSWESCKFKTLSNQILYAIPGVWRKHLSHCWCRGRKPLVSG